VKPRITLVAGARPNFMKIAPVLQALESRAETRFVHTGQHYGAAMSAKILEELRLPVPDINFGVGSGSHAMQTAKIMQAFDLDIENWRPDIVVVAGDVNSSLASALVAVKENIQIAHIEAGLRSFDWTMAEEVNRVLIDRISTWLLTPSIDANRNLSSEGIPESRVHLVGNTMIDTLMQNLGRARAVGRALLQSKGLKSRFGVITLHRAANVDCPERLGAFVDAFGRVAKQFPLVFPVHPRTAEALRRHRIILPPGIIPMGPLSYLEFIGTLDRAEFVLTDSGGIQEEATALGVPCLTLRDSTERPITCELGTNQLVGANPSAIDDAVVQVLHAPRQVTTIPYWDGHAGQRCAEAILSAR